MLATELPRGSSLEWLALHRTARAYGWRVVYRDAALPFERMDWRAIAISDDSQLRAMIPFEHR